MVLKAEYKLVIRKYIKIWANYQTLVHRLMRQASQQNPGNGYKISEQKVKFDAIVEFALSWFGHYC